MVSWKMEKKDAEEYEGLAVDLMKLGEWYLRASVANEDITEDELNFKAK